MDTYNYHDLTSFTIIMAFIVRLVECEKVPETIFHLKQEVMYNLQEGSGVDSNTINNFVIAASLYPNEGMCAL